MRRAHAARSHGSARVARLGWWLAMFQALCLVVSGQLSGLSHAVADLASACCIAADTDDCPDEAPGQECPPGCPTCHCTHPAAATPTQATFSGVAPPTEVGEELAMASAVAPPPSADTRGVWRPPRAS